MIAPGSSASRAASTLYSPATHGRPDYAQENMPPVIVLYDSECGVCNRLVRWLIRRDRHLRLTFASLQGDTARDLRSRQPVIPSQSDTLVLVRGTQPNEEVLLRTRAVLGVLALLPWPWRALGPLGVLPPVLLDPPYRLFAAVRNHLAPAQGGQCERESSEEGRFLP
jgi:predicted DCC family thiol-disulfide oxidoreductase YuxK